MKQFKVSANNLSEKNSLVQKMECTCTFPVCTSTPINKTNQIWYKLDFNVVTQLSVTYSREGSLFRHQCKERKSRYTTEIEGIIRGYVFVVTPAHITEIQRYK